MHVHIRILLREKGEGLVDLAGRQTERKQADIRFRQGWARNVAVSAC